MNKVIVLLRNRLVMNWYCDNHPEKNIFPVYISIFYNQVCDKMAVPQR